MWLRLRGGGSQNLCHCWKQWKLNPGTYDITTFHEYCWVFLPSPFIYKPLAPELKNIKIFFYSN